MPAALSKICDDLRPADNPLDLDEVEPGLSLEASVGTLVHRCLELISKNGLKSWSTESGQFAAGLSALAARSGA
jgi:hypothetical protein